MTNIEEQRKSQENLEQVLHYGNLHVCLRRFLLHYFNEDYTEVNCGNCDRCVVQTPLQINKVNIKIARPQRENIPILNKEYDHVLFEKLRKIRTQESSKLKVPAYIIFGDKALQEMATHFPQTHSAFLEINGVGNQKLSQFGEQFMSVICNHIESCNTDPNTKI